MDSSYLDIRYVGEHGAELVGRTMGNRAPRTGAIAREA
jgi:hypothetical protein